MQSIFGDLFMDTAIYLSKGASASARTVKPVDDAFAMAERRWLLTHRHEQDVAKVLIPDPTGRWALQQPMSDIEVAIATS